MSKQFQWPVYGHKNQLNFLQESIRQDKFANSYLFYGPKGLGKKLIAHYFVQSLFCQDKVNIPCKNCYHCRMIDNGTFPDFYTLGADGQELSVENVREFLRKLSLSKVRGEHKIALIYGVDNINLFGANALLKTLEEPTASTSIILLADSLVNIPSTVISRCQLLKFKPLNREDMSTWLASYTLSDVEKDTIINLSFGKPGIALAMVDDKLVSFKKNCNFIVKLLEGGTYFYMQTIDRWFDVLKKEHPEFKMYELGVLTKEYLDLVEVFLRDLLWLKLQRPVVNELYRQQMEAIKEQFSADLLIKNLFNINELKLKLRKNVSPQILWENLFLNLK